MIGPISRLTEMLLCVAPSDEPRAENLSFWTRDQAPRSDDCVSDSIGHLPPLTGQLVREAWGRCKWQTATVWARVASYLDLDAFVDHELNSMFVPDRSIMTIPGRIAQKAFRGSWVTHKNLLRH
jgi:hypothetical protein